MWWYARDCLELEMPRGGVLENETYQNGRPATGHVGAGLVLRKRQP